MDILTEYVEQNILSKANILKYVDDYSIYSFYIGEELELYTKYSSPLREGDDDPSFSIYYSKYLTDQIWYKDQSSGKFGNVFQFLQEFMEGNPSLKTVLLQINSDFGLGLADDEVAEFKPYVVKKPPVKKEPVEIQVTRHKQETQNYLDYWGALEVPKEVRDLYYFSDVSVIHYIGDDHITIVAKTLTISYEILGCYKVYQPFAERKYKFRNNYLDTFIEGAMQLKFHKDFAIISKATKECAFFRAHFDWEVVAGKSENTMITPYFMNEVLKKRYKRVFIWLDGDPAGVVAQQRYLDMYPWLEPIVFDECIQQKDPTDFFLRQKERGLRVEALDYLQKLITNKLNGRITHIPD